MSQGDCRRFACELCERSLQSLLACVACGGACGFLRASLLASGGLFMRRSFCFRVATAPNDLFLRPPSSYHELITFFLVSVFLQPCKASGRKKKKLACSFFVSCAVALCAGLWCWSWLFFAPTRSSQTCSQTKQAKLFWLSLIAAAGEAATRAATSSSELVAKLALQAILLAPARVATRQGGKQGGN